jgi:hypothetical protein
VTSDFIDLSNPNRKTSGAAYGAAAFMLMIFVTDWKCIATKIPGYNRKFFKE